jgi:4-carboxymuconolactone decarboxylase
MPEIPADKLTDAQKKASAEFAEGRGYAVRGPFAAMLRSPEVMLRAKAMGDYLRFKSTIPPRLNEFAILITARQWTQNYEWQAHRPLAEKAGLKPEISQAIAEDDARRAWRRTRRSCSTSAPSCTPPVASATPPTSALEVRRAGHYRSHRRQRCYSFNAMILNVGRIALPKNAKAELQPFPRWGAPDLDLVSLKRKPKACATGFPPLDGEGLEWRNRELRRGLVTPTPIPPRKPCEPLTHQHVGE